MEHGVDAVECARDRVGIADVAGDQLDIVIEVIGTALVVAVDLRIEVIKYADSVAALQEGVGQMRPDEARTSSNQNSSAHSTHFLRFAGAPGRFQHYAHCNSSAKRGPQESGPIRSKPFVL
jgi:hypothetical protein